MKVWLYFGLVAVLSLASARPDSSAETATEPTEEEKAKELQDFFNLLANQEKLAQSSNLVKELEPLRLYIALNVAFYGFHSEEKVKLCSDKYEVTESEASQVNLLSGDVPEKIKCTLQCLGEQEGVWKDGQPAGTFLLWKQFSDVILDKYSEVNEELTKLAQQGRECMTYETTESCSTYLSVLKCIQRLQSDDDD